MRFAGFIMTYERPEVIMDTIAQVFAQSVPPEKLLIVDNSESNQTKQVIEKSADARLQYLQVGYNAGPAGAARIGLKTLVSEGYDWIYWGDDDDPPQFQDSFESLLKFVDSMIDHKVGILGGVGQYFNRLTGSLNRVETKILDKKSFIEVDSVAGGQSMIVHAEVIRKGILPDEKLFFGFEELDFCIRVRKAGFKIMVSGDLFLRARDKWGRMSYQRPTYLKKNLPALSRQYYSTRNMLVILWREKLYLAWCYNIGKVLMKLLVGFRYGWIYGRINFRFIGVGLLDAFRGTMGKINTDILK